MAFGLKQGSRDCLLTTHDTLLKILQSSYVFRASAHTGAGEGTKNMRMQKTENEINRAIKQQKTIKIQRNPKL